MLGRLVSPATRASRRVSALTAEAECLFWRLLVTADAKGRFRADPGWLRRECFPLLDGAASETLVRRWVGELRRVGLVATYQVGGVECGTFDPERWPAGRSARDAATSRLPAPPDDAVAALREAASGEHAPRGARVPAGRWGAGPRARTRRRVAEARVLLVELRAWWNELAVPAGLSRWDETERGLTAARVDAARRVHDLSPEEWRAVVERVAASPFLTGRVTSPSCPGGFRASPDWLLREDAATRVLEGAMDGGAASARPGGAVDYEALSASGYYGEGGEG